MGQARPVTLRYARLALADLSAILDHIAARSPQGARRVQARIRAVIDLRLATPPAGPVPLEKAGASVHLPSAAAEILSLIRKHKLAA